MRGIAASMSLQGFITEPTLILDRAIAWFFASRRNQSIVLRDIESYVYIREINQGTNITPERFCDLISEGLQRVINCYFDSCYVEARPVYDTQSTTMFTCYIACTGIRDGKHYDMAKSVLLNNKTYERVETARQSYAPYSGG